MLPETFWGRIQYLLQQYGTSFLSGAGNTMIIAIVGTFLGCLIGFIVGIIQTIPVDQRDSTVNAINIPRTIGIPEKTASNV